MHVESEYRKARQNVSDMSNEQVIATWDALANYDPKENYASDVSMDDWCQLVYSEMHARELPMQF